jgi:hypothetical protein
MEEIQYQRNKLKMNLQRLQERSQQNHLLESVVKDYEKYEKHLRDQDEAHYKQMVMIQTYLEDIMETNQLTESGLNQLEHTHIDLLKQIDQVKEISDAVSESSHQNEIPNVHHS